MDSDYVIAWVIAIVVFLTFAIPIGISTVGFQYPTGQGQQTGYITAVEKTGVFFKTWTAYVKTDTTSTQEDSYCVKDPAIIAQLLADSSSVAHVTIDYYSVLSPGVTNCNHESDIISSVEIN